MTNQTDKQKFDTITLRRQDFMRLSRLEDWYIDKCLSNPINYGPMVKSVIPMVEAARVAYSKALHALSDGGEQTEEEFEGWRQDSIVRPAK